MTRLVLLVPLAVLVLAAWIGPAFGTPGLVVLLVVALPVLVALDRKVMRR